MNMSRTMLDELDCMNELVHGLYGQALQGSSRDSTYRCAMNCIERLKVKQAELTYLRGIERLRHEEEMRMEHKCTANEYGIPVRIEGHFWYLGHPHEDQQVIKLCPYCGEKLELPDVKIGVLRSTLDSWADRVGRQGLHGLCQDIRYRRP